MFVRVTAPLGTLGALRCSTLPADVHLGFERLAAVGDQGPSSLVVDDARTDVPVGPWLDGPAVDDLAPAGASSTGARYRLAWTEGRPELFACVRAADGVVCSAVAEADAWTVELRFPDDRSASRFYASYDRPDYPLSIQAVSSNPDALRRGGAPSAKQQEAVARALEAGYFEVPRRTTQVELAAELDISDAALSQRLRRGVASHLVEALDPAHQLD